MRPFIKLTTNVTGWLVASLLVAIRTGCLHAVQHLRASNWFSREALIFESQYCTLCAGRASSALPR